MAKSSEGPPAESRVFVDMLRASPGIAAIWSLLLAFVVTMLTCMVSGALKTMGGEIAPIWLTNAVLLAQLMVAPPRRWYWVLAGGTLGNLAANLLGESL